jgi:AcrR family transcriptional regulator
MKTATRRKSMPKKRAKRAAYHHGDLRQALIDATLALAAERGIEQVSVREVGQRAGVSPGAPFRHFPTRVALMTAVAEQAMQRFQEEIVQGLASSESLSAIERLRALGRAYLRWVLRNPTHFEVISARRKIDFDGSDVLVRLNEEIRSVMVTLLAEVAATGKLRIGDVPAAALNARAFVYGMARMWTDGHFAQWGGEAQAEESMHQCLDDYLALLTGT